MWVDNTGMHTATQAFMSAKYLLHFLVEKNKINFFKYVWQKYKYDTEKKKKKHIMMY